MSVLEKIEDFIKNTLKNLIFLLQTFKLYSKENERSGEKDIKLLSCSEFHQLSGGPVCFCCRSHFKWVKCQQSGPIGNLSLRNF